MKIFDSHTHIFPQKIAEKAIDGVGDFYKMSMHGGDGVASDLISRLEKNGLSGAIVCSVATSVSQTTTINDFIAQSVAESAGFLIGFCSLHPDMSEIELDNEILRAVSLGLRGVKIHPDFQTFRADGKRACKIYEVVGNRLPILIHAGDKRFDYSSPVRVGRALDGFPEITMIAAHLGGWSEWEDAVLSLSGRDNLYVDTSSSLYALSAEKVCEYIAAFGEERVLFGTDYPMWDIGEELERFNRLNLSDSARKKILYENAKKLLKINQ